MIDGVRPVSPLDQYATTNVVTEMNSCVTIHRIFIKPEYFLRNNVIMIDATLSCYDTIVSGSSSSTYEINRQSQVTKFGELLAEKYLRSASR